MADVFISYSRKDKPFVERLARALEAAGHDVWVDFEDIPFATEWWDEICAGIEASESAVFVISPDSVISEVCGLELNHILKNNKRLIPILYRIVDRKIIPAHLAELNWISFKEADGFDLALKQLSETVSTDLETLRLHTRLLTRAREWEKGGHADSLLLRGSELLETQPLLGSPNLTDLMRRYLVESIRHHVFLEMLARFAWGFAGGLLGIGVWAFSTIRPLFPGDNTLITPARMQATLALGQVFGLCLGAMAVLAGELTDRSKRFLPDRSIFRIIFCLIFGVLAWASYLWFLDNLNFTPQDINALLFGGIGLAAGFVARILFDMPGWLAFGLTAIFTYVPIYVTFQEFFASTNRFISLVLFDDRRQILSVAIPMTVLMALGANGPALLVAARALFRRAVAVIHPARKPLAGEVVS